MNLFSVRRLNWNNGMPLKLFILNESVGLVFSNVLKIEDVTCTFWRIDLRVTGVRAQVLLVEGLDDDLSREVGHAVRVVHVSHRRIQKRSGLVDGSLLFHDLDPSTLNGLQKNKNKNFDLKNVIYKCIIVFFFGFESL